MKTLLNFLLCFCFGSLLFSQCVATESDILGPYFVGGSPVITDTLFPPTASPADTNLRISGTITNLGCQTPKEVVMEIWQADSAGDYSNVDGNPNNYHYRGKLLIGNSGTYTFLTKRPGLYPSSASTSGFRPSHIHFTISWEGIDSLVTQLYFEGDPNVPTDAFASVADTLRIIPISYSNGEYQGTFDIILDFLTSVAPETTPALTLYPNPAHSVLMIEELSPITGNQDYSILNVMGVEMEIGTLTGQKTEISLEAYPIGLYFFQLGTQTIRFQRR